MDNPALENQMLIIHWGKCRGQIDRALAGPSSIPLKDGDPNQMQRVSESGI